MGGSSLGTSQRRLCICRGPLAIGFCAPLPLELADARFARSGALVSLRRDDFPQRLPPLPNPTDIRKADSAVVWRIVGGVDYLPRIFSNCSARWIFVRPSAHAPMECA